MTTIVWDGKTLATDGKCTAGGTLITDKAVKLYMDCKGQVLGSDVIAYAIAGSADMHRTIKEWIREGCPLTKDMRDDNFAVIIITKSSAYMYSDESTDLYEIEHLECLGSGRYYAHSAVILGKSSCAAVKHASALDVYSGGEGSFVNCRTRKPVLKKFTT